MRCVIVDNDDAFLEVAQALLERDGMIVAGVAHSSAEAVQRAAALEPDVVLIDIRLGRESGFDAARQLAANGQSAALIMISTHAGASRREMATIIPSTENEVSAATQPDCPWNSTACACADPVGLHLAVAQPAGEQAA